MHAERGLVERFLARMAEVARDRRRFDLIPRVINNETAIALGLTRETVRQEILQLTADDYHSGPEPDRDRPGDIWVFGKRIEAMEVYIKLKLVKDPETGTEYVKCLSFHEAERRIEYPLRKCRT